jgi:hypothetical protein
MALRMGVEDEWDTHLQGQLPIIDITRLPASIRFPYPAF